jgi:hypothetical protein
MAKREETVVRTQMPSMGKKNPSLEPAGGIYNKNKAPFDKPQDMGNGGVATKFFDDTLPAKVGRTTVSGSGVPASNLGGPPTSSASRGAGEKARVPGNKK